ncbi:MAG: FlgD immunoglobulin-like domain containing protein [bacterium]
MQTTFVRWTAVAVLAAAPAAATIRQVPGSYATIGAALAASSAGDVVQVAPGTYSVSANGETFPLSVVQDVHLAGAGMGLCTLDAQGSESVVSMNAPSGGRVSGFTITGGRAPSGGGFLVQQGDPEIDHNLIVSNGAQFRGAGIFAVKAGPPACAPWIHHNVVWMNYDTVLGDAVDVHGVVTADNVRGVIENNLIGRTDGNGALTSTSSAPTIRQNIFFENGTTATVPPRGRGICWLSSEPAAIYHNLFHANVVAALLWPPAGGNFSGAASNDVSATDLVYGNADGDPLLRDVDALDFRLQPSSPAIDAGDPSLPHDPDGTVADVGPFWFDQSGATGAPETSRGNRDLAVSVSPNPFRADEGARIRWSVARDGDVSVTILDVAGRRVRTLASGRRGAGTAETRWDGRAENGARVAAGVYLVLVREERGARTAPVLLLR